jgi:hypothetical protein
MVAITSVVTGPKGKNETAPQREKAGLARASRWSGVTVRGDPTGCSASRWSAMGRCGLTTQNHFRLDRDRPSHGSRDREGVGAFWVILISFSL